MNIFEKVDAIIEREGGQLPAALALGLSLTTINRMARRTANPSIKISRAVAKYNYQKKKANGESKVIDYSAKPETRLQVLIASDPFKEVPLAKPVNPAPTFQEQELEQGVVVDFVYEKLTDGGGAYRFKEVDGGGNIKTVDERIVGTLYLRKKLFSGQPPKAVTAVLQVKF